MAPGGALFNQQKFKTAILPYTKTKLWDFCLSLNLDLCFTTRKTTEDD
jgi:hypothetical protein